MPASVTPRCLVLSCLGDDIAAKDDWDHLGFNIPGSDSATLNVNNNIFGLFAFLYLYSRVYRQKLCVYGYVEDALIVTRRIVTLKSL